MPLFGQKHTSHKYIKNYWRVPERLSGSDRAESASVNRNDVVCVCVEDFDLHEFTPVCDSEQAE